MLGIVSQFFLFPPKSFAVRRHRRRGKKAATKSRLKVTQTGRYRRWRKGWPLGKKVRKRPLITKLWGGGGSVGRGKKEEGWILGSDGASHR